MNRHFLSTWRDTILHALGLAREKQLLDACKRVQEEKERVNRLRDDLSHVSSQNTQLRLEAANLRHFVKEHQTADASDNLPYCVKCGSGIKRGQPYSVISIKHQDCAQPIPEEAAEKVAVIGAEQG